MEVHHHSHGHGAGWKHHAREFLMLFAAVTLGFFAENVREHYVERHRERDYLAKIAQDLRTDLQAMEASLPTEQTRLAAGTRVMELYDSRDYARQTGEFYYQSRLFMIRSAFVHTNSGFLQVLHSGGMRLISDPRILEGIQSYEFAVEKYRGTQDLNDVQMADLRRYAADVFDTRVFNSMLAPDRKTLDVLTYYRRPPGNPPLMTTDEKTINRFMQSVFTCVNLEAIRQGRLRDLRDAATRLVEMIEPRK
jgi:hypothetical protein